MKRFSKVCLMMALVLGVLGVAGCTAGIALGAGKNIVLDEMRTQKTLYQVERFLDMAEQFGDRINQNDWSELAKKTGIEALEYDDFTDAETTEYTFSKEEVKNIQMQTIGDIQIKASEDAQVKVIVKARNCKIQVQTDQGGLKVTEENGGIGKKVSAIVRILLPKSVEWEDINLETSAGDISVAEALQAQNIQMKSKAGDILCKKKMQAGQSIQVVDTAGDVEMEDFDAPTGSVKVMSGDLDVKGTVKGNTILENLAGDTEIKGRIQGELQMNSTAGDVALELKGTLKDYDYDIKATCGDVNVNDKSYEKTVGGAYQQEFGAENKISVKCTAGDVDITVEE